MKIVNVLPLVHEDLCKGCRTCEMVCPVYAVKVRKEKETISVRIDAERCVGCWNCEQRCPEHAIEMTARDPVRLGVDVSKFDYRMIRDLCQKARFHPKQIVCYCTGSRAEELAAAILEGAGSPDEVVRATGIGSGCGIECNQPILRFLEAAGCTFERKRPSFQWYGRTATVWEVPEDVKVHHSVFRFDEDREIFERIISAPVET